MVRKGNGGSTSAPFHLFGVPSGIRERVDGTWYLYRHHLIEAKQSDETNKREGMQASSLISSLLLLLLHHHFVAPLLASAKLVSLVSPLEHVKSFHFDLERYRIPVDSIKLGFKRMNSPEGKEYNYTVRVIFDQISIRDFN